MGIDPGTVITGYGLIKYEQRSLILLDCGTITPPKKESLDKRFLILFNAIEELVEKYKPDGLVVETQFVGINVQSAMKVSMARVLAVVCAGRKGIPVYHYTPTKVKKAIVGLGHASKERMKFMVEKLLHLTHLLTSDEADALGLAICHIYNKKKVALCV